MNVKEIKFKHISTFKALKSKGIRNRFKLMALLIPGAYISFYLLDLNYYRFKWYEHMPYNRVFLLAFFVVIGLLLIIFSVGPNAFVNSKTIQSAKIAYKKDIYTYIRNKNPEISGYLYKQKIHPQVFKSSKLFNEEYADYKGDDWFKGRYNEIGFELCELHVSKMYKPIFNGIFIRCKLNKDFSSSNKENMLKGFDTSILEFQDNFDTEVRLSITNRNLNFSINRNEKLFENDTIKVISKLDFDLKLLNNSLILMKYIIDRIEKQSIV